ncbi:TPA: EexN family lipoprotein [Klebsiella pneumoniae]|uniref:EexN family lipoprotein n=1 Tax=Serratia fonticola TaxID=47917 RepID=UPI0017A40687|nr:EexN family lipoprotein [Escherichia coli]EGR6985877.1 EexN family lipoprotein [Salmonella enterica subsp. enterica serovar Rissen]EGZ3553177.1 EexN family lipoprotein [Salmonella enterica]HCR2156265.1 EexN family lipoprotein [Enterobacter asburiae]EHD7213987.1 EexN family lipoprotein [Escherichia coli]
MRFLFIVLTAAFFTVGCNDKVYDVDYYFSNQVEAKSVLNKCKIGEVTDDNCKNAREALQKQSRLDWIKAHGGK